ncbi:glycosyltransferase [Chryseobacterium sp. C-71]|uniref:glycosyltransferase n=1 Tax=Chryseobacterium sp. C-71 TaxID=2893882 RepID=UPI001E423B64|nr:glycosyltransferase [Chryseobacterium sp. C-71]UFH30873.1 glycosyltransferase [Chryseobacterium sp. C-71]
MGKRYNVVLNYQYDENWIGGTYYIQNLIHALQTLKDEDKPFLHIKSTPHAVENLQELTSYPYLKAFNPYSNIGKIKRAINIISKKIAKKNIYSLYKNFDAVFPAGFSESNNIKSKIFWIPDFQEKYLPHFFSEEEIKNRENACQLIRQTDEYLIFSSEDAKKDFNTFYPQGKPEQFVLNFATYHRNVNLPSKEFVLEKFDITTEYFLCSNQFWVHKNHLIILKAIALLKNEGLNINVIFTGKENDYRNPDYFSDLKRQISTLEIEENVKFLGFIDRDEQIVLLKNCKAIIQPSLFEGWSTVNEDAKAENVFILASSLNVNIEQTKNYPNYRIFDPYDENSLANEIKKDNFVNVNIDYTKDITKFGEKFIEILKTVISKK